jgi:hypothetical protein
MFDFSKFSPEDQKIIKGKVIAADKLANEFGKLMHGKDTLTGILALILQLRIMSDLEPEMFIAAKELNSALVIATDPAELINALGIVPLEDKDTPEGDGTIN